MVKRRPNEFWLFPRWTFAQTFFQSLSHLLGFFNSGIPTLPSMPPYLNTKLTSRKWPTTQISHYSAMRI